MSEQQIPETTSKQIALASAQKTERPIIIDDHGVNAILEGRKTVTRLLSKRQLGSEWELSPLGLGRITSAHPLKGRFGAFIQRGSGTDFVETDLIPSPVGMPGNRLWVREAWQGPLLNEAEAEADPRWWKDRDKYQNPAHCAYRARGDSPEYVNPDGDFVSRWRSSGQMPRWASRLLLEVTSVRLERLHQVTPESAEADLAGFNPYKIGMDNPPMQRFYRLWCDRLGEVAYFQNPWVWVIEFKRVQP